MNEGNSPNAEECSETLDDAGLCAAYAEIHHIRKEIEACLALEPLTIRVREGWAADNLLVSLAVTMAHIRETLAETCVELETAKNDRNKAALQERQKYLPLLGQLLAAATAMDAHCYDADGRWLATIKNTDFANNLLPHAYVLHRVLVNVRAHKYN